MSLVLDRVPSHQGADFCDIHCACLEHPHIGLCGEPRNGRPAKRGATVTCVVCADLKAAHFCPLCNHPHKEN